MNMVINCNKCKTWVCDLNIDELTKFKLNLECPKCKYQFMVTARYD